MSGKKSEGRIEMDSARNIDAILRKIYIATSMLLTIYLGVNVFWITLPGSQHYAIFMAVILFLSGLSSVQKVLGWPASKRGILFRAALISCLLLLVLGTLGGLYLVFNGERLETVQPFISQTDIYVGVVLTIVIMGLTLIHWGPMLTGFIVAGVLYFFYGHLIDVPILGHPEYSMSFLLSYMGMSMTSGFFWLGRMAADTIFFIVIFSNVLRGAGMINLFVEVGKISGRWVTGGAAFPAIIGSGLTGMVAGEAVSNVVLTGRFTIPVMMRYGFSANFAGAVEASAGSSGQIMPPIMGLSAFIMAAFLDIPYVEVCKGAFLPAILYVIGIVIPVIMVAKKIGIGTLMAKVDTGLIKRMLPIYILSFGTVLGALLLYYSPNAAGLMATIVAIVLYFFQGKYRPPARETVRIFNDGYEMLILLCLLLIAIGPLTQAVVTTNLSGRTAEFLAKVLPHNLPILLAGTAVASVFIGLGAPTPVAYIMTVLIMGPFLQEIGVVAFLAHLFIFYYAAFSTLTPPVAPACLAAAKISGGHYTLTGIESMKIAAATLIIPFMFVMNPALTSFPDMTWGTLFWFLFTIAVQFTLVLSMQGYYLRDLTAIERWIFFLIGMVGTAYALYHVLYLFVAYVVLMIGGIAWLALTKRPEKERPKAPVPVNADIPEEAVIDDYLREEMKKVD
jgi:TRAP transporter 4TM/12TM fusion protein